MVGGVVGQADGAHLGQVAGIVVLEARQMDAVVHLVGVGIDVGAGIGRRQRVRGPGGGGQVPPGVVSHVARRAAGVADLGQAVAVVVLIALPVAQEGRRRGRGAGGDAEESDLQSPVVRRWRARAAVVVVNVRRAPEPAVVKQRMVPVPAQRLIALHRLLPAVVVPVRLQAVAARIGGRGPVQIIGRPGDIAGGGAVQDALEGFDAVGRIVLHRQRAARGQRDAGERARQVVSVVAERVGAKAGNHLAAGGDAPHRVETLVIGVGKRVVDFHQMPRRVSRAARAAIVISHRRRQPIIVCGALDPVQTVIAVGRRDVSGVRLRVQVAGVIVTIGNRAALGVGGQGRRNRQKYTLSQNSSAYTLLELVLPCWGMSAKKCICTG